MPRFPSHCRITDQ